MAYSSDFKRQLYEKDCKLLIKLITGFKEEEENFQLCEDFTLSNLLFHSFLDANNHKVKHSISGLHEKYLIHSDLKKANRFKSISDKLLDIFNKKYGSEKEAGFSVLSLLLLLSEKNNSSQYVLESVSSFHENEEKSDFDWGAYLLEGDEQIFFSDTSSEAFTSEDDSIDFNENDFLPVPPRDDSGVGISPDSCSGGSQQQFHLSNVYQPSAQDDLGVGISPDSCSGGFQQFHLSSVYQPPVQDNLKKANEVVRRSSFYPYWVSKYQQTFSSNRYNLITVNFTKTWEEHIAAQDSCVPIMKKVMMHERNVVKEILWMLNGVKDLFLFNWNGYEFNVNPTIHLCNLTSNTLSSSLREFCEYGTKCISLQNFVEEVLSNNPSAPNFCLSFHTYASALQKQLHKISNSIRDLEKRLQSKRETFTILNLQMKCKSILHDMDTLYVLNQHITDSVPDNSCPFEKACRLLHIMWEHLSYLKLRETELSSVKIVLTMFLETCKPFFTFLESLIIHGNFKDSHQEFICTRNGDIKVTDVQFWEHGLILKELPSDIEENFFLKSFFKDIINAGKSVGIFNKINSLLKVEPFRLSVEKGELYLKFVSILQKLLCRKCSVKPASILICDDDNNNFIPNDPLLSQKIFSYQKSTGKFFCPNINPVYMPVIKKESVHLLTEMQVSITNSIESLECRKLKSVNISIMRAFDNCMKYAYFPTCRRLVKALKEKYNLMTHMSIMQKYFLMESGDLMFSFYSKVFEKIFYNEPWQDVSFLYSVLQNAISEDKDNCESLCVFLDNSASDVQSMQTLSCLSTLQLSYEVEWPVSIMLGTHIQNQYCQISSFLLQIKCAKYLLDELYCHNLYSNEKESRLKCLVSKSIFPNKQKVHGMYILRMRLMYFVNGLHNYIMARILHSFGLDFNKILENAQTIDEMIVSHNSYLKSLHERCFLDRRLPHLKEQIFQVLNLCYSFQKLWLKGIDAISLEELEYIELEFSRYSIFLFSYFNTPLKRGVYVHLENLVHSMLSETHGLHIFQNKRPIPSSSSSDRLKR